MVGPIERNEAVACIGMALLAIAITYAASTVPPVKPCQLSTTSALGSAITDDVSAEPTDAAATDAAATDAAATNAAATDAAATDAATDCAAHAPYADFSVDLDEGPAPHTVRFECLAEGQVTECIWDFGDGSHLSTDGQPMHTYERPGRYTVDLTVSGPGGTTVCRKRHCIVVSNRTIHVSQRAAADNDGLSWDCPVPTISQAIDIAIRRGGHGWTVLVDDGVYTEPERDAIDFDGYELRLASLNGPENCVIDLTTKPGTRGFLFQNDEGPKSCIHGFTVRGACRERGAAILCQGASPTISNCHFISCAAEHAGGALACIDGAAPAVLSCRFKDNVAATGGAVYVSTSRPVFEHCSFENNSAASAGGAIYAGPQSAVQLHSCSLTSNVVVAGTGGAVHSHGGLVDIDDQTYLARNIANGNLDDIARFSADADLDGFGAGD